MVFSNLLNDNYISSSFDSNHAKLDNYQIYSALCFDQSYTDVITIYVPDNYRADVAVYSTPNGTYREDDPDLIAQVQSGVTAVFIYRQPSEIIEISPAGTEVITSGTFNDLTAGGKVSKSAKAILFQSFSPLGKITFDMVAIAKSYPIKTITHTIRRYRFDSNERLTIDAIADEREPDISHLWLGYPYDTRLKPRNITAVATSTRTIKYSYYRRNMLESHPKILATLDYLQGEVSGKIGETYTLPIIDPMLGTLHVDAQTKSELLQVPETDSSRYPASVLFAEALPFLFTFWRTLQPPTIQNFGYPLATAMFVRRVQRSNNLPNTDWYYWSAGRNNATITWAQVQAGNFPENISIGGGQWLLSGSLVKNIYFRQMETLPNSDVVVRVLAANNDRWQFGTITVSENSPDTSHPIFTIDEATFFESTQPDGSFGTYMVDSPRILEIHAALDAAKFAVNDIDSNSPRVTNLGYWIEKCGILLGHRPNANGLIDHALEKANYSRQRIPRPIWGNGQYSLNQFGSRGMCIPHLPNTYTGSGKLAKLYDVVYDIPQLLQALHDQVDIAQGIQHASQIRVKHTDGSIQSFPDMLSVQLETLKITASMRESVTKNQISAAVTGAEVRELFSAIGAPTSQKYLTLKDSTAGKVAQVPYFGHQQGKESITAGISTLKINMAIALGVLMPKAQPAKSKLNPFQILTKKA